MARSGTTVIQRLASELEGVWVPPETQFWRYATELSEVSPPPWDPDASRAAAELFASKESSRALELDIDEVARLMPEQAYLWDLFEAIVDSLSPPAATVLGEKTPDHLRWAGQLLTSRPALRVVGVVRDPRAVYRSHLEVPWGLRDVHAFTEKWVELSRRLDDYQRLFADRVAVVRYEDVAKEPDIHRNLVAELLDLPDAHTSEIPSENGSVLFTPDEWWKSRALEPIRPLEERWPRELSDDQVAIIEWRASSEMAKWGYAFDENQTPHPSDVSAWEQRATGARIDLQSLPIDGDNLTQWRGREGGATYWRRRTEELKTEHDRLRRWVDDLRTTRDRLATEVNDWKRQAAQLAATTEKLTSEATNLRQERDQRMNELRAARQELTHQQSRLQETRRELSERKALARNMSQQLLEARNNLLQQKRELAREKVRRLVARRQYTLTAARLQRLRARRWWQLAGIVSRWRRRPWRVDRTFLEMKQLTGQKDLPPTPDLTRLDEKISFYRQRAAAYRRESAELRTADRKAAEQRQQTGRRPASAETEMSPSTATISLARSRSQRGEYEKALEILDGLPPAERNAPTASKLARDCYTKLGEISLTLREVHRALRAREEPALRRQARILKGRLLETEPWWLPDAGPVTDGYEPTDGTVLHLLKESLPYQERGYTLRSHGTLMAQRAAGFHPVVVTSLGFPRRDGFEDFPVQEFIDGIPHHRLDLGPGSDEAPFDLALSDQARLTMAVASECRPAVVQAGSGYRGYETALVGLAVARTLGIPLIYEVRSFLEQTWTGEVHRSESGEYYHRRLDQERRCMAEADIVITIAESMREELIRRGAPDDRTFVVPNIVDIQRFKPRPPSEALAERYGLGGRPVLGYISNLGPREGIQNLVEAIYFIRQQGRDVAGLIVGDGPEHQHLSRMVSERGLEDHVVLTGHVPNAEIEDHYSLIDLFVVPRIEDRASRLVTPLKPLEAMAMGRPVIVSDLPALRELVDPPRRGMTFPASDPSSLADVAIQVLEDEELRGRMVDNALEWVRAERTVESNALRYKDILSHVL